MDNNEEKNKKSVVAGETTEIPIITEEVTQKVSIDDKSKDDIQLNDATPQELDNEKKEIKKDNNKKNKKENDKENKKELTPVDENKKKMPNKVKIIIIIGAILLCFVLIFGIIVCVNKVNNNVYKNIYLGNVDLSGYTAKQVEEYIDKENEKYDTEILIDVYQDDKKIKAVSSKEIDFKINKEETVKDVMSFGRKSNIFVDNFNIILALFKKQVIDIKYEYSEEILEEILKNIDVEIDGRFVEDKYNIDEKQRKLIIKRGKRGNSLIYDKLREDLIGLFIVGENTDVSIYVEEKIPNKLVAQDVYNQIKREPEDASVDRNKKPVEIKNEVYGIDFEVSKLQALLDNQDNSKEESEFEFELNFIEPKVKLRDISQDLCIEKIAGLTTYFDAGQYGRANNLRVALEYLNDIVIMPGEVFSYNAVIGDTNAAKGYMEAAIFKGGRIANEMGGGICQTSSTLYNVALLADLEIVERHAHGLPVGYVKPSLDATVYGDVLDFKFKNTRSYPIKIVTSFSSSGDMNISLYGTKEEIEYDIELVSNYLYTVNYTTEYIQDPNMYEGQQEIEYNGVNGYASEAYFIKRLNGEVIENRYLSKDVYSAQIKTVRVGTKTNQNQGQS